MFQKIRGALNREAAAGGAETAPGNRGRMNFSSNKVNWETVTDDLRRITELRDLLVSLENIEQVASKLILDNPRFWVELDDRPGSSRFWNFSQDYSSSSVDSWYLQSLNAELYEDEEKATSLKKFAEFDNDAYKAIAASSFEQLAQDPTTASTATIEQGEDEELMSHVKLIDRPSIDFDVWKRRIYQLCALKDEVFQHYVLPEESSYPFSLLPLEKFRYFHRELATICRLSASLKVWMERRTPETVAVLSNAKWLHSLIPFVEAAKLLAAISMQLSVIFLTIKKSLEEAQKVKRELVPNLGIQLIAHEEVELTIEGLEGVIAQETEKLRAEQETIASLQQQKQDILQAIEFKKQQDLAPQKKLISTIADTSDEKRKGLLREELYAHIEVTEASTQAMEAWEEDLRNEIPYHDIADCQSKITQCQEIIADCQDRIKLIHTREENKRKKAARDALHQQAVANAEETWALSYDKAVGYLTEYIQHVGSDSVLPVVVECPSSDIMLLRAVSQQDELDKLILKEMQVDEVKRLELVENSAGGGIYADASEQQLSHLLVSTEFSQSSAVGRDTLKSLEDVSQKILDRYRAEFGADEQILQQLESVFSTEVSEEMQDSPQERESMFSFVVRKPSSSVIARPKVLSPSEELALHRLIRTTTQDQRLAKIIDECYVGYNLCTASLVIQQWLKIQYQRLYLRFSETTVSEEMPFFNYQQLKQLTMDNWMLSLCHVIEKVTAECDFESLAQQRVISIVKVLHKMMEHVESLPEWVDGDIFDKIDNSEDKNDAKQLTEVVKVKLAFSLVLELLCDVLDQVKYQSAAAFLLEMQAKFMLKFSIEGTKKTDIIALAIYFLSLHQAELLQGTNFKITDFSSIQSSPTEKAVKETSKWGPLRSLAAKATGVALKNKDISQVKSSAEPVCLEVNETVINLVVAERSVILLFVNNDEIFMGNISGIKSSVRDKEQLLGGAFLENYPKIKKHELDDEDGYRKALEAERARDQAAVAGAVAGVTGADVLWSGFYEAMKMSGVVRVVLCSLVLENPDLNVIDKENSLSASSFNIADWMKEINALCDARNDAAREIENRVNGVTEAEERSLNRFIFNCKQLASFLQSTGLREFLPQQRKPALDKFVQSVQRLNAIVMMLCIITLAVKREQGQAREMMRFSPDSRKIHSQSVIGEASVTAAWSAYARGIEFFSAYVAKADNIKAIKLDDISVLLPSVKTHLIPQWIEQFPKIATDSSFIDYFQSMLQPQLRSMSVVLGSGEYGAIISLRPTVQPSTYALQVHPERLYPEFTIARVALNVKGRAPYSLLKVADIYDDKVGIAEGRDGEMKVETLFKGLGAVAERDQVSLADASICSNSRKDSFALQGFLSLLYFVTIQNARFKTVAGSRMAQSLAEFAANELGIDLEQFRDIFKRWVRPRAFDSSERAQAVLSGYERELFVVNLALTMAVVRLQSAGRAVLTNHQLQFAIRANGYLTVLHIYAFIENLEMYKGFNQSPEDVFCILNQFIRQCGALFELMPLYLSNNPSSTLKDNASKVSGYQRIKLAFIFVLVMYKEIFATLKEIGTHRSQYAKFENLFTHILREYFLSDDVHDSLAYSLAFEFFETNGFFPTSGRVALGAPVEQPGCFNRTLPDSSTITATERGFATLGPVRDAAKRSVLLQRSVSSFFAATQVDPEEVVLLMAVMSSRSSNR